ncbi:hypothetical protein ACCAA_1670003 [Candidatus Accumulibacter aalborgensis]|uniref:Uncharacterized protein n=1 Tax=Candidatus Accumulibacter aalborgensis TaxID=1860102 RepID=A0A1A8XHE5_9PROT|nr:hypothetical protein ACCAA_1670003 [Candidatus Accumulibacter aalborgensis]
MIFIPRRVAAKPPCRRGLLKRTVCSLPELDSHSHSGVENGGAAAVREPTGMFASQIPHPEDGLYFPPDRQNRGAADVLNGTIH